MSKRSEIISYVKKAIEDADLLDGPIFDSKSKAYTLEELPCALVLIEREEAEVFSESPYLELKKKAELTVQLVAEHAEGAERELHDVFFDLEHLLLGDDSFGQTISRVTPEVLSFETFFDGERPIISGSLKLQVTYFEAIIPSKSDELRERDLALHVEVNHGN